MKPEYSPEAYKEFISVTLDLKNSPIPSIKESELLKETERNEKLQIFKIKNGETRIVFCIHEAIYDEFIENTTLFFTQGLEINMFSDQVKVIHPKNVIEEFQNEQ